MANYFSLNVDLLEIQSFSCYCYVVAELIIC